MDARSSVVAALTVSLLLHAGVGASLHAADEPARRATGALLPFTPVLLARTGTRAVDDQRPVPVRPGAPDLRTNIDTEAAPGASQASGGSLIWIQSMPVPTELTLRDADFNTPYASQLQRIDTATGRASLEMRRQTPHPADAVYLASGRRGPPERVPEARSWPTQGAAQRVEGAAEGLGKGTATSAPAPGEEAAAEAAVESPSTPGRRAGLLVDRPGAARHAAPRSHARPSIDRGSAGTLAELHDQRVRDDQAAELLAASLQRSIVDTTRTRAQRADAAGAGASALEHALGLGHAGAGAGSSASALRPGPGELGLLDTRDTRYIRWFGQQRARVAEHLSFPRERALTMDQGQTLVLVRVLRSGAFAVSPSLYRTSGYAQFDEAALRAVRDAGSFSPLPDEILPGEPALSLLVPVKFDNPMVR